MRLACFFFAVACCCLPGGLVGQVSAMTDSRMPNFPPMPEFAADGVVHILPSTMSENSTSFGDRRPGHWTARGYSLQGLLARVYRVDEARVEFADAALAAKRFDVTVGFAEVQGEKAIDARVQDAFRTILQLSIVVEDRVMEVEVLTSPQGPGPGMRLAHGSGGIGGSGLSLGTTRMAGGEVSPRDQMRWLAGKVMDGAETSGSLSVGGPVSFFCRELERMMDRPVVDETGLSGAYDIRLRWEKLDREGFFRLMREELGLVVTAGHRGVTMVTVRAR